MTVLIRLLLVIVGYAFGLFQTGYIYGKITGNDLRKVGSGNTGATNALRTHGFKAAFLIFFFDALKAFIPCFAVRLIFMNDSLRWVYLMYTALGVILGNDYPFYLKFKGGKGVAATCGYAFAWNWAYTLIGLALFLGEIRLPEVLRGCLSTVASLNTPLAMFTVGIYLAQTEIRQLFTRGKLYLVALVRLGIIPLAGLLLLSLVPEAYHDMKLALLLAVSCPVGSNVAVYAQLHGKDYPYAVETVVVSTLLSILSIPAVVWAAQQLW